MFLFYKNLLLFQTLLLIILFISSFINANDVKDTKGFTLYSIIKLINEKDSNDLMQN
jgi:hypothetical protein